MSFSQIRVQSGNKIAGQECLQYPGRVPPVGESVRAVLADRFSAREWLKLATPVYG